MDCVFCKIIKKEIPSNLVYEDDFVVAFNDLEPQAPVHILIVPKEHISSCDDLTEENSKIVSQVFLVAKKIAEQKGLKKGYRIINNCKEYGGQTVKHIHFHLVGGKKLSWPAC